MYTSLNHEWLQIVTIMHNTRLHLFIFKVRIMTKNVIVEVISVEPPCPKCKRALEVEAVRELGIEDKVKVIR